MSGCHRQSHRDRPGSYASTRPGVGVGDVDSLRSLPHSVDDRIACLAAVSSSERIRNLVIRAQDDWLIEAEDALARNKSTLAVQSMDRLLGDDGILATLRKKGYTVEGP